MTSTPSVRPRPPSTSRPTTITTPKPLKKPYSGEQAAGNTATSTILYTNQPFNHPVMDIINKLSNKIANTAEFFAGMLRGVAPQVLFHSWNLALEKLTRKQFQKLENQGVGVTSQNFHKRLQNIVQNQQKILFRKTVVILWNMHHNHSRARK